MDKFKEMKVKKSPRSCSVVFLAVKLSHSGPRPEWLSYGKAAAVERERGKDAVVLWG